MAVDLNSGPASVAFHMKDGSVLYEVGLTKHDALRDTQCGSPTSRRDIKFYIDVTPEDMQRMFGERYERACRVVETDSSRVYFLGQA